MAEPTIAFLDSIYPLEEQAKAFLLSKVERYSVPKKQLLVSAGRADRSAYLIIKGVVRVFKEVNGKERTTWLFPEGSFAVSLEGFYAGIKGDDNLEMLEDGEVAVIKGEDIDYLYEHYPSFNKLYRKVISDSIMIAVSYLRQLQTLSPTEIYENFVQNRPDLNLRVPQKYIASLFGIHEKTLVKIRKKMQTTNRDKK